MSQSSLLLASHYLPCIEYLQLSATTNSILIEQQEHYTKGNYFNRAHIASAQGLLRLSIPLEKGKNQNLSIKDIRISYAEIWQRIHWQSICSSYNHSPYFEFYKDDLGVFYTKKVNFLIDWNTEMLQWLFSAFKLKITIQFTSEYNKEYSKNIIDKRNAFNPKFPSVNPTTYPQAFETKTGFSCQLKQYRFTF